MAKKEIDDRFKRFGTVSFTSASKVNDFIDHLEAGRVTGTVCPQCNIKFFPPRADCCKCHGLDMEWFDAAEETGRLLTYSHMKYGPQGFEDDLPYTIAVADFGGYRIFGRLAQEIPVESLEIGMPVTVAAHALDKGRMNFVFNRA